jgi:hypothetical protein
LPGSIRQNMRFGISSNGSDKIMGHQLIYVLLQGLDCRHLLEVKLSEGCAALTPRNFCRPPCERSLGKY